MCGHDEAASPVEDLATAITYGGIVRPPGLPAERFIEYAQLFADKVIPAFT
jgi:hypothetical protein